VFTSPWTKRSRLKERSLLGRRNQDIVRFHLDRVYRMRGTMSGEVG